MATSLPHAACPNTLCIGRLLCSAASMQMFLQDQSHSLQHQMERAIASSLGARGNSLQGIKRESHSLQGRYMAVDFAADLQQELDYFAGPFGMGVDGFYIDCTRTSAEWSLARWVTA